MKPRYMTEMAIDPIYPKPSLSTPNNEHKVYPYLLRNAQITTPNQAWSIDITYIKLEHGCQFTNKDYIEFVKGNKVKISMDGKSRWADNIMIERWFRTLKCEEVYINRYKNIREARAQIGTFIHNYNFVRFHSALDYQTPASMYYPIQVLDAVA